MNLLWEIIQFLFYAGLIVVISKEILVRTLRSLAEKLKLKPKTVGDIAGIATSVPELLTISAASINGLIGAGIYNVLSSNVINLIQYVGAITLNKNHKSLQNKAIKVLITILLPLLFSFMKSELSIVMVPILFILYLGFKKVNNDVHQLYLPKEDDESEQLEKKTEVSKKSIKIKLIRDVVLLIATGVLLFFIGEWLGNTLDTLCVVFNIPEIVIGIILGFVTSIPELITFFEAQKHHKTISNNNMHGVVEATNNLLMSNMMNLFIIQSIGILLHT